jgi:2-amino-4-hydroxy-6-hydroxymethyldihydropteridine diphosphokinase
MKATISLGSNLGDRFQYLQNALDSINVMTGTQVHSVSPVFETDPVGGPEQGQYLNAVAVVKTILSPEQFLVATQQIELEQNRERNERWGPRTLDIDLLAMDSEVRSTPELELPHPRAHERAFVLLPWSLLDPDFVVPGKASVADLLANLEVRGIRFRNDLELVAHSK